jgi:hypothetical protein
MKTLTAYQGPDRFGLANDGKKFRDRRFFPFSDRKVGFESDFHSLEQSLNRLIPLQQPNGCFFPPEILSLGEKSDDHLGLAGMLAYYLTLVPAKPEWEEALRRAIRFQLGHLLWTAKMQPGRYVRYRIAEDSSLDWCNTLWVMQSVGYLLKYARPFVGEKMFEEVGALGGDIWDFLSHYPQRDETPCHNQLLEFAALGYSYGAASGREDVRQGVMTYYRETLRHLRVKDRGRWIYTEFNRWCAHYALLSWSALEMLWTESHDPIFEEDALEMAAAFNDRLSAGGYTYGGSRRDEAGYEEFLYPIWVREKQFGFNRLLLMEPSERWQQLVFDGHNGRCLVGRMPLYARGRPDMPFPGVPSSSFTLRHGGCSVFFNPDTTPHQISVNGLEVLEASTRLTQGGGLIWKSAGIWKQDELIANPPPDSQLHRYNQLLALRSGDLEIRASMQRGVYWEIRQWWITDGTLLGRFFHLFSHNCCDTEEIRFILGNPYLAEDENGVHPIREVLSREGSVATQGQAQSLRSTGPLRLCNQSLVSTHPLQFVRPDEDAFDGFPTRNGRPWSEQEDSNRLEILLSEHPRRIQFRESIFAAAQIGETARPSEVTSSQDSWQCRMLLGGFRASEQNGDWKYQFQTSRGTQELTSPAFRLCATDSSKNT